MFVRSILLGGTLGLVYDLLRTLRRLGGKLWGGVLDALFCLLAVSSLFFFAMARCCFSACSASFCARCGTSG